MFKDLVKDLATRLFLIHLAAFTAGVLICAAINLWLSPGTLWFPWVALGWGAALATHGFALFLRKTRRRERIFIDKKARSFAVHLFAYVATVLILLYVNLTVTPDVWWFYWVALGRRLPWLVHVLQEAAALALSCRRRAGESEEPGEEAKTAEASVSALRAQALSLRRSVFTLRSTTSQIMAAMSGPPKCATCLMPVGEVTLISVR
jgi:2TM domain